MNKILNTLALCVFAFGLGFGVKSFAFSNIDVSKIAYIDVNKLVLASKTVKQAQETRDRQTKEMLNWYDSASNEIEKQQTKEAKQSLIAKYENQLTQKKNLIQNEYSNNIEKANNQISSVIDKKAKELGYLLILRKDSILFGGEDITSSILPLVK